MTRHPSLPVIAVLPVVLFAIAPFAAPAQQSAAPATVDMTPVQPESVGFSSERLERLHTFIQQEVDKKQLAGAVTILARHGKIVDYRTYGVRDFASGAPMTKDTIFRDYSMTKPVTGVAMMILYEAGQVAALRPHLQIHSRVRPPQGLQRRRRHRQNDPRRSRPRAHHARADDPHRRIHLRRSATRPSTSMYQRTEAPARQKPSGDDRPPRADSR